MKVKHCVRNGYIKDADTSFKLKCTELNDWKKNFFVIEIITKHKETRPNTQLVDEYFIPTRLGKLNSVLFKNTIQYETQPNMQLMSLAQSMIASFQLDSMS